MKSSCLHRLAIAIIIIMLNPFISFPDNNSEHQIIDTPEYAYTGCNDYIIMELVKNNWIGDFWQAQFNPAFQYYTL